MPCHVDNLSLERYNAVFRQPVGEVACLSLFGNNVWITCRTN